MTEILIGLVIGTQAAIIWWMWCTMRIQRSTVKRLNDHGDWLIAVSAHLQAHDTSLAVHRQQLNAQREIVVMINEHLKNRPNQDDADWWKGEQE